MYKYKYVIIRFVSKKTKKIKRLKIPPTKHEFIALNLSVLSFSKKSDPKIYINLCLMFLKKMGKEC